MKAGIHPELKQTKVSCLGCGTTFNSVSTVDQITVDVCSQCHPFYTGKQKLVDTAGRVDRFRAKAETAKSRKADLGKKASKAAKRAASKTSETPKSTPKAKKTEQ